MNCFPLNAVIAFHQVPKKVIAAWIQTLFDNIFNHVALNNKTVYEDVELN